MGPDPSITMARLSQLAKFWVLENMGLRYEPLEKIQEESNAREQRLLSGFSIRLKTSSGRLEACNVLHLLDFWQKPSPL